VIKEGRGAKLEKAAELGRFNMGSTVVLAFEPGKVTWNERFAALTRVRMGERIGTLKI
jgi:phosphatidylserine decarboxylase